MPDPKEAALRQECRTFCRYLVGRDPTDGVMSTWLRSHAIGALAVRRSAGAFDRLLLTVARGGAWRARAADTYAVLLARRSLLRTKLVVMLAILETQGATWRNLDHADGGSRLGFFCRASGLVILFGCVALGTAVIATPVRVVLALKRGSS